MWRTVSFVDNIELDFAGNVMTKALDLGDVDNDKQNELVVGNIEGDLAVFKGDHSQPWKKASKLGMITCVQIGDIFNIYKNLLVCLNAEGCCYIFAVKGTEIPHLEDWRIGEENDVAAETKILTPVYTQNLPANSRAMLIRDTDGDGLQEMAVVYSDRVVRSFRWVPNGEGDSPFSGRLHQVDKWQLAGQIGAVTVNQRPDGSSELMVSQPGRTYVTLLPHRACSTESDESKSPSFVFHPLGHSRARNKDVSTVIVGGIQRGEEGAATYHALASLDGTLVLVENDRILWSLQVDHQLFVLDKLDVTGNGKEEVVCCSWDGQTYIVNHSRDVVRYHFKENVAAFAAGYYSVPGKGNVPCFIYATFSDHIYIHHNISLPCVESASLLAVMQRYESTPSLLKNFGIDPSKQDTVCALYHWLLYGWHQKPETTNVC